MSEIRIAPAPELRASSSGPKQIFGYAATFGSRAQLPGFTEEIRAGAFSNALASKDNVACLLNHNTDKILGTTRSGTLRLAEDRRGLSFVCDLPDTAEGRDAHTLIARGDLSGVSFGFMVDKAGQSWSEDRDADGNYFALRTLTNINRLTDVSPTVFPAYDGTSVSARSEAQVPVELRSRIDSKNRVHPPRRLRFVEPTMDELLNITIRAKLRVEEERTHEMLTDVELITRRQALLNAILS